MSQATENQSQTEEVTLNVMGMGCEGCATTVKNALSQVAGVETATVNLNAEKATVRYNASVTGKDEIVAAVKSAGYIVR